MDTDWQAAGYRELQIKAKELGIKANQKKEMLVSAIVAHYAQSAAATPDPVSNADKSSGDAAELSGDVEHPIQDEEQPIKAVQQIEESGSEETVEQALHDDDNTAEETASNATYVVERDDDEDPEVSVKTMEAFPKRNSFFSDDDSPSSSTRRRSSASRRSIAVPHIDSVPTGSDADAKYRLALLSDESVGEQDLDSPGPSGSLKRCATVHNLKDLPEEDLETAQSPSGANLSQLSDDNDEEHPSRRSSAALLPLSQTSIDQESPAPSDSHKSFVVADESGASTPVRETTAESRSISLLLSDDNDEEQPSRRSSAALLPLSHTSIDQESPAPSGSRKSFVVADKSGASTPVRETLAESRNISPLSGRSSVPMAMRSRSIVTFEEIEQEVLKTPGGTLQDTPATSGSRKRKISTTTTDTPPPRKSSHVAGGALGIKINQASDKSCKENTPDTSSWASKKSTPRSAGRRFDAIHQKMFDSMDSIDVAEEKKQQRLARIAQTTPDRIKRLATPKNCMRHRDQATPTTSNVAAFDKPKHPSTVNFRFGDVDVADIAKVQKPAGTFSFSVPPKPSALPRFVGTAKTDVKQRTMMASRKPSLSPGRKTATTPAVSERLARLSTPKTLAFAGPSSRRAGTASASASYTPKKGRFQFVDTTKMTDAELARFHQQQAAAGSRTPLGN